jgi:predicted acetyltransferase
MSWIAISMFLSEPNEKYKQSFVEAMREMEKEGSQDLHLGERIEELDRDFETYRQGLQDQSEGKNLKSGYVAQTTYWLIDDGEYIGQVRIRHALTEALLREGGHIGYDIRPSKRKLGYGSKILELALSKAKELGIGKALLTCDVTNTASLKIIEKNGGILANEIPGEPGKASKLRFWIEIK